MFTKTQLAIAALCGIGLVSTTFTREAAAAASAFKPGDEVVATVAAAPLMRGYSTLATAAQGQTLRVLKVDGPWVGTTMTVNGKTIGGWVWSKQLLPPQQYQAMRQTIRRSYSYQPAPVYVERYYAPPTYSQPFIMSVSPYGESYWRADRKIMGY